MAFAEAIKRELRSAQTRFPGLRRVKFDTYNWATQNFGWRIEPEFKLLSRMPSCKQVLDIGGNWGQSIHAIKRCADPEKIVSFEPNPVLAARLAKRFEDDPQVQIEDVGLGENSGEFDLHIPSYRSFEYDGLASLDFDEAAGWLRPDRVARFDPAKLKIAHHSVRVKRLDDFGFEPDAIKIDVQGLEEAVVRGGIETISRHKPLMIIEAPSEQLVALLSDVGLQSFGLRGGELVSGLTNQRNCVFMSQTMRKSLNAAGHGSSN